MSNLEELIEKLCHDGVEYKTLTELFDTKNGYTPSKSREEYWTNGTVPWFRMEDIRENGNILSKAIQYVSESAIKGSLFPADSIIVATSATIGQHALIKVPSLANQRFTYLVLKDEFKEQIDIMFIYYCCFKLDEYCKECLNQGNFASVDMKKFLKFKFPVPPLEVQREIVRILDNFTFLTTELAAELAARQKQYEYYRDLLFLSLKAEYRFIPEFAKTYIGLVTTMTQHYVKEGVKLLFNSSVKENHFDFPKMVYLDNEFAEKNSSRMHKLGDIITVHTGDVGTSAIIDETLEGSLGFATIVTRIYNQEDVLPKYVSYYLNSNENKNNIYKLIKGDRNNLNLKDFNKLRVPIPSLEQQQRIVDILDRFDTLCNDISSGLPAEIEMRQKQYEYYRDKLLTFKELKKEA